MNLIGFARNLDRVIREIPEYAAEIMKQHQKEILDIQEKQLSEGIKGDGTRTLTYKSNAYIKRTNKSSAKSFPHRNYYLSGDFYEGLFLIDESDKVLFGSFDEKTRFIEDWEKGELFGIAPKNTNEVSNIISKDLIRRTGYELIK